MSKSKVVVEAITETTV